MSRTNSDKFDMLPTDNQLELELTRTISNRQRVITCVQWFTCTVCLAAIVLLATRLWIPIYRVSDNSMAPFLKQDQIVVGFYSQEFEPDDIVALYFDDRMCFRKIIGTSGNRIDLNPNGDFSINNSIVKSVDLNKLNLSFPYVVPDDSYFVVAQDQTKDVATGIVEEDKITAKIFLRIWPLQDLAYFG